MTLLPDSACFACLHTDGKYSDTYVEKLYRGIRKHCQTPLPFVCFTDSPETFQPLDSDMRFAHLPVRYQGWWNKIWLFDASLTDFRHFIFFDLDTVILKSIDHLIDLIGTTDLAYAQDVIDKMSSSVLIIDRHCRLAGDILRGFDYTQAKQNYFGDQDYFMLFTGNRRYRSRGLHCRDHYSYKYLIDHQNWRAKKQNPLYEPLAVEEIVTLNFHGAPKPHQVIEGDWPLRELVLKNW